MKSKDNKSGKGRKQKREFRFEIDAFTPETMPMDRLIEYLKELSVILGEHRSVHLLRVEEGSTVPVLQVEREAVPSVRERIRLVREGDAPRAAQDASDRLNRYLREDNARAVIREWRRGPRILEFPGVDEAEPVFHTVIQAGSISGELKRVGGTGDKIQVLMESEGNLIAGCHTTKHTAKMLGSHLFEQLRLTGQGYWERNVEGDWNLKHFRIDSFEALEDSTLSVTLAELRTVTGDWDDDAYEDLRIIRGG